MTISKKEPERELEIIEDYLRLEVGWNVVFFAFFSSIIIGFLLRFYSI